MAQSQVEHQDAAVTSMLKNDIAVPGRFLQGPVRSSGLGNCFPLVVAVLLGKVTRASNAFEFCMVGLPRSVRGEQL